VFSPLPQSKLKVPENIKTEVEQKALALVDGTLKPNHVKPPPAEESWNYIIDIYTKWYRNYFYFCAKYRVPGPNAISPFFEAKFARMEYLGDNLFNLAYMRHTEEWFEIYAGLSVDQCIEAVKDNPAFYP
jgi:hypothetical protein